MKGLMPYKTVWVKPEKLLTHKGVTVYHTYKHNEVGQGPRTYWFATDPQDDPDDGPSVFDVRDLPQWMKSFDPEPESRIKETIRLAIQEGNVK